MINVRVDIEELKGVVATLGHKGSWSQGKRTYRFRSSGCSMTYWPKKQQLKLHGEHKDRLWTAVSKGLGVTILDDFFEMQ